ncbi:MAG: hypothetical protein WC465_03415 [Patescibacteria group bacterium]
METNKKIFYPLFILEIPLIGVISLMIALFIGDIVGSGEIIIYIATLIFTVVFSFILFKIGKKSKLAFYLLSILISALAVLVLNFIFSPLYS